ncbi:universal stress protein [Saccharibacillus sp. CPCC 101409]|uniref:universal stress protein n=1 Tax=Saccharibacillus sp. CPCC 101409 TaxID=3058041 RepID=UPI0026723EEE|nr:universal stress protein [Saccharibacillus sp. CPCC 101409]MDO3411064.1 universal stress protein [Saccharibacillus sp. CPCC 101409]
MKHIVVAVDGSAGADRALEQAIKLASELAQAPRITALHVDPSVTINEAPLGVDLDERIEEEGLALLRPVQERLAQSGLPCETAVRRGDPAAEIGEFARREGCDLIVMGTRGQSLAKELLLGGVGHKVIQHAPCPVMTVR